MTDVNWVLSSALADASTIQICENEVVAMLILLVLFDVSWHSEVNKHTCSFCARIYFFVGNSLLNRCMLCNEARVP